MKEMTCSVALKKSVYFFWRYFKDQAFSRNSSKINLKLAFTNVVNEILVIILKDSVNN